TRSRATCARASRSTSWTTTSTTRNSPRSASRCCSACCRRLSQMREINYWQIAAGDRGRDYSEFFLRHGVATVGGDPHVQIMKGVKCGDVVILKKGTSHLLAAGKVITRGDVHASATDEEKAQYKHWFEDFDGWEQPAFCH